MRHIVLLSALSSVFLAACANGVGLDTGRRTPSAITLFGGDGSVASSSDGGVAARPDAAPSEAPRDVDAGAVGAVDAAPPAPERADAGPPSVDAGPPSVDAGPPSVDAGAPPVDAGSPSVDAGPTPVDVARTPDSGRPRRGCAAGSFSCEQGSMDPAMPRVPGTSCCCLWGLDPNADLTCS